jgi:Clathrin light chain
VQARKKALETRHAGNRKDELAKAAEEVPVSGTPWEKVTQLINFDVVHQKDVARYKTCLITCKTAKMAVKC